MALPRALLFGLLLAAPAIAVDPDQGGAGPQRWEQLFFPFPIASAPPQLEQQVQLFNSTFTGSDGQGNVSTLEVAYIAGPHLGLVLDLPFQIGSDG